jgi:hypothetical protein
MIRGLHDAYPTSYTQVIDQSASQVVPLKSMPGLTMQYGWHIRHQTIVPQISCVEGVSGEYCGVVSAWYPHKCGMSGRLTHYGLKCGTLFENRQKWPPLNFKPPNPEIITVDPQRKFYGLKNFCRSIIPCQVLLSSERLGKNHSPIDVANLMEKCIRNNYLCVTYAKYARSICVIHAPYSRRMRASHCTQKNFFTCAARARENAWSSSSPFKVRSGFLLHQ